MSGRQLQPVVGMRHNMRIEYARQLNPGSRHLTVCNLRGSLAGCGSFEIEGNHPMGESKPKLTRWQEMLMPSAGVQTAGGQAQQVRWSEVPGRDSDRFSAVPGAKSRIDYA
jgi:hypothetical protein